MDDFFHGQLGIFSRQWPCYAPAQRANQPARFSQHWIPGLL